MLISPPRHNFPARFRYIHRHLKSKGILGEIGPRLTFPDEPQFYQYACERLPSQPHHKKGLGFGASEDESKAYITAIAEAIEHYCILHEQDILFERNSYSRLSRRAVDPTRFVPFSESQLKNPQYRQFRVDHNSRLNWIPGYSLTRNSPTLIPTSLVYANYQPAKRKEPTIQLKNSTGAACGPTLEFAIYRGICEIIERDAYMISFLHNLPKATIDVDDSPRLRKFRRRIERYDLEIVFLSNRLDTPCASVTCLLIDKTGSGPAVCTGLGGSLDMEAAISTAGFEAVRRHISARDRFFRKKPLRLPLKYSFDWFLLKKQELWAAPHMITSAHRFMNGPHIASKSQSPTSKLPTDKARVDFLVNKLKKLDCEVLYVETTVPEVKAIGLRVVKVLIPEMVPLWRDERYPYLGTKRLYATPQKLHFPAISDFPVNDFSIHPF